MTRNENINLTGWIGVIMVVLVHFAGITWLARGMYAAIELNAERYKLLANKVDVVEERQRGLEPKFYAIDRILEDIKQIRDDIKDVKKAVVARNESNTN